MAIRNRGAVGCATRNFSLFHFELNSKNFLVKLLAIPNFCSNSRMRLLAVWLAAHSCASRRWAALGKKVQNSARIGKGWEKENVNSTGINILCRFNVTTDRHDCLVWNCASKCFLQQHMAVFNLPKSFVVWRESSPNQIWKRQTATASGLKYYCRSLILIPVSFPPY